MRIVQILHGKAHWVFEAKKMPDWPLGPDGIPIILMDITNSPEIQEGWIYVSETKTFREPTIEDFLTPEKKEEQRQKYIQRIQEAQLLGETEEVKKLQQEWQEVKK